MVDRGRGRADGLSSRRPELEAWLDAERVDWSYHAEMALASIDFDAGLANQARLEALDEEAVERYTADMERGDTFPAIIVRRTGHAGTVLERLVPVGGNHRGAAARRAKLETFPTYVVVAEPRILARLMYEDNRRHGLPMTNQERVLAALHLLESKAVDNVAQAARIVGLGVQKIHQAVETQRADKRAATASIEGWRKLPESARWRLGQLKFQRVFTRAAKLAVNANLRAGEVYDLVTLLNKSNDEHEALDTLQEQLRLLGWRATGEDERAGSSDRRTLISAMQRIRLLDPDAIDASTETADQREVLADQIKRTAGVLQQVLRRVSKPKADA